MSLVTLVVALEVASYIGANCRDMVRAKTIETWTHQISRYRVMRKQGRRWRRHPSSLLVLGNNLSVISHRRLSWRLGWMTTSWHTTGIYHKSPRRAGAGDGNLGAGVGARVY
jgi:hypothetical protein